MYKKILLAVFPLLIQSEKDAFSVFDLDFWNYNAGIVMNFGDSYDDFTYMENRMDLNFFKNNYLFRDWTDASSIHDYLAFAKSFIAQCEQEYGEEEVKAVVLTVEGESLAPEELIYFLKERMPHFMIPRFIEFVSEIPKTPTLKVQKTTLRESGLNERTWDREKAGIKVK